MNQSLCIGIQQLNENWSALLDQLGLWYRQVEYQDDLSASYSLIILNSTPDSEQSGLLKAYLESGGAVLEVAHHLQFIDKKSVHTTYKKTLLNSDNSPAFAHLPYVDVFSSVALHQQSNIYGGFVYLREEKDGILGFMGADVAALLQQAQYTRKRFYAEDGRHPDEIVSKVSKHQLSGIFEALVKTLHVTRGLPLVQKWSSPSEKPVFCFRIDSDFGDMKSVNRLYDVLERYHIKATWFLHVEAHKDWLDYFKKLKRQEIALHGYEHGTSKNSTKVVQNITKGKELLEEAGFELPGFCAPYGIFNKALTDALSSFNFEYTSEFTFAYDGLPLAPSDSALPLQIPIHPICTGSLRRQAYHPKEMSRYFLHVLSRKAARFEPVLFYHHPLQPGLSSFNSVFQKINDAGFENLTFGEYADFWRTRRQRRFQAHWQDGELHLHEENQSGQLYQVSTGHQKFALVSASSRSIDLQKSPKFEYSKAYLPQPEQMAEMRTKDLRLMKTSLLDWKNRITL